MKRGKERNEAERRHGQKEKDRGPFGLAPTEEWDKKDESEEDECGFDSLESRSSFRKAGDAQGPGLEGDRDKIAFQGRKDSGSWPPCILAVMVPALQSKCTQRTQRELKVKTTLLDLLAESEGTEARAGSESHGAREERARQQAMAMGQTPGPGAGRGGRHSLSRSRRRGHDGEGGRARGEGEAWSWADCEPWKKG